MKKVILIFSIGIFSITANAQMTLQGDAMGSLTFRKSADFNDAAIAGSRYLSEQFQNAKVNKGSQNFLVRYNAFNDLMEYKNGADILELIKNKNTYFEFQDGTVFELFKYEINKKELERYHKVLVNNKNVTISKYQSIKLIPASKAANSYESDKQATFKENDQAYFITHNNVTVEFDGKQKSLEKIITGKSDAIKAFYKENKIKENDSDMIKLGNFLATI